MSAAVDRAVSERLTDVDHPANQVLAFLKSVQTLDGNSYGTEKVRGRDVIQSMAIDALMGRNEPVLVANVVAAMRYLTIIQPVEGASCYSCGGGLEACGFNHVLDWLAAEVEQRAAVRK